VKGNLGAKAPTETAKRRRSCLDGAKPQTEAPSLAHVRFDCRNRVFIHDVHIRIDLLNFASLRLCVRFLHRESNALYDDTMSIAIAGRSLVLVGFMGSGKSSVGRELAKRWNFRFVDTDAMIRHKYDLSIPDIFAKHGEDFFREEEYQALIRLRGISSTVIATGGGIVIQPRNLPLLRALGPVVWLCADQTTILDRVGKSTHRPMLNQANPQESVARLLKERAPLYHQAADLRIETSGLTHREVADRIVSGLDEFRATDKSNLH